ncbi:MAG: hypothetical protein ACFFEV_00035 [Candidatus Thorarchaeota archaeon]
MRIQLEERYDEINTNLRTINEGRILDYSSIFGTELGKKLGERINQIQEFAVKGIFTIFPFNSFISALKNLYANSDYLKAISDSGASEDDLEFIEYIRNNIISELENGDKNQIFNEVDERILLGALVTSIYSLLDGYSKDAIALILQVEGSALRILRNYGKSLSFSFREVDSICRNRDQRFKEIVHSLIEDISVLERLRLIKSGTGIWDSIDLASKSSELDSFEQLFKDFVNLRNVIAHQNPMPTSEKYLNNDYINMYVKSLRDRFERSLADIAIPPKFILKAFNLLMEWLTERQTPIGITIRLTTMASVFPAIIDNAIQLLDTKKPKYKTKKKRKP